jgi:hypothetical protein
VFARLGGEFKESGKRDLIAQNVPFRSDLNRRCVLNAVLISPERLTEASLLAATTTLLSTASLLATSTATSITTTTVTTASALLLAPAAASLLLLRAALRASLRLFHDFVVYKLEGFILLCFFKVEDGSSRSRFTVSACRIEEKNDDGDDENFVFKEISSGALDLCLTGLMPHIS